MIQLLMNWDYLMPRLVPVICFLLLLLALRIRLPDVVYAITQGGGSRSGSLMRGIISMLLLLLALVVWLLPPSILTGAGRDVSEMATASFKEHSAVAPGGDGTGNLKAAPASGSVPVILAGSRDSVIIQHGGNVLTIRLGQSTPDGWILVSASKRKAMFIDRNDRQLLMAYSQKTGKWDAAR